MRRFGGILILLGSLRLFAAEIIPPPPAAYFNDYARAVPTGTAARLNQTLEDFERQSSDQILVAVYPKMQSDSSVEDYTVRVARSWQAGQKAKNNGAVLFVFVQNHKLFLQVGYGLEGVLPDALCKRIIEEQITPRFKAGDFDGGLTAGVQAILAATKGEYQGIGTTAREQQTGNVQNGGNNTISSLVLILLVILFVCFRFFFIPFGGIFYSGSGRSTGGSFGGGGFSGGGGGGGFSGGGGSFGGGGAGGSW